MDQEQKKLMPIKEFSKLTDIEESTLRYWDRIGLFHPARRHKENKYRLYALEQAVAVDFITVLSSLKLPLKAIGEAKENRDPQKILSLFRQQEFEIDKELTRLQGIYSTIHTLQDLIHQGIVAVPGEIGIRHLNQMTCALGPLNTFHEDELFYRAHAEYRKQAKRNLLNANKPFGGYHADLEHFTMEPALPHRFFLIDPMGSDCRPEGDYLVGYAQGYYGQVGKLPEKMAAYAEENGLVCEGPVFVIYMLNEICIEDPMEYLAQASVQVRKRTDIGW
jgi:DNA-binding transcriptional MerR regulator